MCRAIKLPAVFILVQCFLFNLSPAGKACSAGSEESADSKLLVARAEVIVRAVAVKYSEPQADLNSAKPSRGPREIIEFRVEEVLKGELDPATLHINGWLSDKDDFNDWRVTFDYIRNDGRGGSCHAYSYKQGGEFLLFMVKRDDRLTPYWASMAPSNQQLRPIDDPWLEWVKRQLTFVLPVCCECYLGDTTLAIMWNDTASWSGRARKLCALGERPKRVENK